MTNANTKFLMKQVGEKDGQRTYTLVGTVILKEDPTKGYIKSDWGDLQLFLAEKQPASGDALYTVKKAKKAGERTFWHEVGNFLLKKDRSAGTVFLHLFDQSFPAYLPRPKPEGETGATAQAA